MELVIASPKLLQNEFGGGGLIAGTSTQTLLLCLDTPDVCLL